MTPKAPFDEGFFTGLARPVSDATIALPETNDVGRRGEYMRSRLIRVWAVVAVGLMALGWAAPASAEWRRAESERFIVYSEGRESELRDYVRKLEIFDLILRQRLGVPVDQVPPRKLPIYLVEGPRALATVFPSIGADVVGIYTPSNEDIFAVAIRDGDDDTLLHEYTHHFMFQHSAVAYPSWLVEGFAEYFATTEIEGTRVEIGQANVGRAIMLADRVWIPLDQVLTRPLGEIRLPQLRDTYYPVAWVLTHWMMGDPERSQQLQAYIDDVGAGGDPAEALVRATGMSLGDIEHELRDYIRGRIPARRYDFNLPAPPIAVTTLPPSADGLLLLNQRLKVGVNREQRDATTVLVRQRAAAYPDDPFALLALGHAELHFGDPEAGEAALTRLLEIQPDNVEALQLMATREIQQAQDQDDPARLRRARGYLGRAFAVDDANFRTFVLLGSTREGAADYPNENDVATWELANTLAPQLPTARLGLASALMRSGQSEAAVRLLRPLANAPHGGGAAQAAQTLLAQATAGQAPLSDEAIAAAVDADNPEGQPPAEPETPPEPGPASGR